MVSSEVLAARRGKIPTAITDDNGEFVFRSVEAGEYYVVGHPLDEHVPSAEAAPFPLQTGDAVADAARLEPYKKFVMKKQTLAIAGADPEDVPIEVSKRARISGTVTVEGNQPIQRNRPTQLVLY